MSGDTSPLGAHWARFAPQQPTNYERTNFAKAAAELAADLAAIDAGTYPARVVLARYTGWEILGVTRLWGLRSDESRRLYGLLRESGL